MKNQLMVTLKRLKNPTVFLSVLSQIISIMALLNISINVDLVTGTAVSVCSILVTLGIMSNPTTKNKGYGDDMEFCENCNEKTEHFAVGDQLICRHCGTIAKNQL